MTTEAKTRTRTPKSPVMPDFIKPLAELPLASRKEVWQMMDDLEAQGNGEGCTRCAVAEVIRNCLTIIGK